MRVATLMLLVTVLGVAAWADWSTNASAAYAPFTMTILEDDVFAQDPLVYTANVETGYRYNPQNADYIVFEDTPIPIARFAGMPKMMITKLTVGLRRLVGAPGTRVEVYWGTGRYNAPSQITSVSLIGFIELGAATSTHTLLLSAGDGTNELFTVEPDFTDLPGYGNFFIGMRIFNPDVNNGWRIVAGPDANVDAFKLYSVSGGAEVGNYWFGGNPFAQFYVTMEGRPVPEPGSLAALAVGIVGLLALRRRK